MIDLKYAKILKETGWNMDTKYVYFNDKYCVSSEAILSDISIYPAPDIDELLDHIPTSYLTSSWIVTENRANALAEIWCEAEKEKKTTEIIEQINTIVYDIKLDDLKQEETRTFLYMLISRDGFDFLSTFAGKDIKDAIKREIIQDTDTHYCNIFGCNIIDILDEENNSDQIEYKGDTAIISSYGLEIAAEHILKYIAYSEDCDYETVVVDITDSKNVKLLYPERKEDGVENENLDENSETL